jgi:hypothetical protein
MQSLRGIGASSELSPLPELLDAMEVTTRSLLADLPAPPDVAAVFGEAAHALAAMARAVADSGRIVPPAELDRIAAHLLRSFVAADDITPIEALAPGGMDAIEAQPGLPSTLYPADSGRSGDPVPVELVGVGDHLQLVADALDHPGSPAARDLRLFVLYRTLATMPARSGTGRFLAPLARAITAAIASGTAAARSGAFVALLRDAGRFLVDAGTDDDRAGMARRRDVLAGAFSAESAVTRPAVTADSEAIPIVPIGDLAPDTPMLRASPIPLDAADELPIVPIEDLAPFADLEIVPIDALAYDAPPIPDTAPGDVTPLERAFAEHHRLAAERGIEEPALATLIGAEIVTIESLLYRGSAALARAEEIRTEILALLAQASVSLPGLRPYISELLDLVPLAREAA